MVRVIALVCLAFLATASAQFDPYAVNKAPTTPTPEPPTFDPSDDFVIRNDDIGPAGDECNVNGQNPCFHGGLCFNQTNGIECVCPPGYVGLRCETRVEAVKFTALGNCEYASVKTKLPWLEAMRACHVVGSELASIHSYAEDVFVSQLASDGRNNIARWIGFFNPNPSDLGLWAWSDYQAVSYKNWFDGNPIKANGRCVYQDNDEKHPAWANGDCEEARRFVCKRCYKYSWNKIVYDSTASAAPAATYQPAGYQQVSSYQPAPTAAPAKKKRKVKCNKKCKKLRKQRGY